MNHMNTAGPCRCSHHVIAPVLIILLGFVFLLQNLGIITTGLAAALWPAFLILIGLVKLVSGSCKCYEHVS